MRLIPIYVKCLGLRCLSLSLLKFLGAEVRDSKTVLSICCRLFFVYLSFWRAVEMGPRLAGPRIKGLARRPKETEDPTDLSPTLGIIKTFFKDSDRAINIRSLRR